MNIAVLGAGTWGTALAKMLFDMGHSVALWSAFDAEVERLRKTRRHTQLPNMVIPDGIHFTSSVSESCISADIIVCAVPSLYVRETIVKICPYINSDQIIVNVSKGIEAGTLFTMTKIIEDVLNEHKIHAKIAALSGPTHAEEVALDMPTTIVAASEDIFTAEKVQNAFMNSVMRVYTNTDILGVEICGALKNIIALAAGISKGIGYGDNAKAALITRGIAEIARLGMAMGCAEQTFSGLAGIGDLIVTATSEHSRNNRAGQLIGAGMSSHDAIKSVGMVVEGINALPAAKRLSELYRVEMPIINGVDKIINHGVSPKEVVNDLMARPKTTELPKFILDRNCEIDKKI